MLLGTGRFHFVCGAVLSLSFDNLFTSTLINTFAVLKKKKKKKKRKKK